MTTKKGFWHTAVGRYTFNLLISIDQLGNTITGGSPDETISSRIGKIKQGHSGKIPWNHPVAKIIDSGLEVCQKDHSINAIEADEGKDAVIKDHSYKG